MSSIDAKSQLPNDENNALSSGREVKRYKAKSKTEFLFTKSNEKSDEKDGIISKVPGKINFDYTKPTSNPSDNDMESGIGVGLTIQERLN